MKKEKTMEQQAYWKSDLLIKRVGLFISFLGFVLIIVGVFATRRQLTINTEQLKINTGQSAQVAKSIRANVENGAVTHVLTLDKVFMDRAYLAPYFYDGKPIDPKDPKYAEVQATAVMVLDLFDMLASQSKHYPEFWDTPEAWDTWMIDVFSTSPILRDFLDTHQSWYGKNVQALREQAKSKQPK
jgi:hypothetical protein